MYCNAVWRSISRSRTHGCGVTAIDKLVGVITNRSTPRGYCTHLSDDYYGYDTSDSEPVNIPDDDAAARTAASWLHCGWCGHRNRVAAAPPQRQHLYLVVDDWSEGFSVHKLDLDEEDGVGDDGGDGHGSSVEKANHYQRPPPPAVRVRFANVGEGASFAAMGSKIVACTHGEDGLKDWISS